MKGSLEYFTLTRMFSEEHKNITESTGCEETPPPNPYDSLLPHPSKWEAHTWAWFWSGVAALIAIMLSLYLIIQHLRNYNKSKVQKHICRILLMVPIYAVDSWFSFRFFKYSIYMDVARDTYEAFVIYEFVALLVQLMGGPNETVKLLKQKEELKLPIPFCRIHLEPLTMAPKFMRRIKQGALQYVIIRPVTTILACVFEIFHVYCPGTVNPRYAWPYLTAIIFVSVTIAMYALVALYECCKEFLKSHSPLLKFGSIKFVIFFSFWQLVVISLLVKIHIIRATTYWTADNIATGIQNCLICFEMLVASIVHVWAFSHQRYVVEGTNTNIFRSFLRVINVSDVAKDTHHHLTPSVIHKQIQRYSKVQRDEQEDYLTVDSENTPLIMQKHTSNVDVNLP